MGAKKARHLDDLVQEEPLDRVLTLHITKSSKLTEDPQFIQFLNLINHDAEKMRYDQNLQGLRYALKEAVSNAYKYGNGKVGINVNYMITPEKISIIIQDNAQKPCNFDMNKLIRKGMIARDSDAKTFKQIVTGLNQKRTEKYAYKGPGGMGLFQIGYLSDNARAVYEKGQGNIIYLEQHRKA